jgi:hypothetical protein
MDNTFTYFRVENAGGTDALTTPNIPTQMYVYSSSGVVLAANYTLEYNDLPALGTSFRVWFSFPSIDVNGNTISIFGATVTADMITAVFGYFDFTVVATHSGNQLVASYAPWSLDEASVISGATLMAGTTALAKLASGTSAQIIVANAGGVPTYVAMSGDGTITNAGVFAIAAGVIVDADVNASAAITRSKIAAGTAAHVVINAAGTGLFSSEAQLANSRGGTGQDTSASTGFAKVASGTWSVAALTDVLLLAVSFETGEVGDFKITMPFAGTVTEIYAYVTKAIAATDDATITPKNQAGTTMTDGVITFTASDPRGTAETSTPSANNTFIAGDVLTFTAAKATAGGKCQMSITITRTS